RCTLSVSMTPALIWYPGSAARTLAVAASVTRAAGMKTSPRRRPTSTHPRLPIVALPRKRGVRILLPVRAIVGRLAVLAIPVIEMRRAGLALIQDQSDRFAFPDGGQSISDRLLGGLLG